MRFLQVLVGIGGLSAMGIAAPKYHVTRVETDVDNGFAYIGNDGSLLANRHAGAIGASIYYRSAWSSASDLTGAPTGGLMYLKSHDTFSGQTTTMGGVSYYQGVSRFTGASDSDGAYIAGPTNASGDYVGAQYKNNPDPRGTPTISRSFVVHNGVKTYIDDYGISGNYYPTWITDSGYIGGVSSPDLYQVGGNTGWYTKPGSLTKTITTSPIAKISEAGDLLETGRDGSGAYIFDHNGKFTNVKTPDNNAGSHADMNNSLQVVVQASYLRPGVGLWDNGNSYWLDELLDNPEDLPTKGGDPNGSWSGPHINDSGQIACTILSGKDGTRNVYSLYRFDPVAVPEPSSFLVLGIGALALRRRRSRS